MSAWETTIDDVKVVLDAHGVSLTDAEVDKLHDDLDHDAIEEHLLCYCDLDALTQSMFDDIENELLAKGVIKGEKQFNMEDVDEHACDSDEDQG